jgi:hypothetical protein
VQKIFWLVLALIFYSSLLSFAGFMAVLPGEFASAFYFFWIFFGLWPLD